VSGKQCVVNFLQKQATFYGIQTMHLVVLQLEPSIAEVPPPRPTSHSLLKNMLWSLQFRYWAYINTPSNDSPYTQVSIYVIYHRPDPNTILRHSTGLAKGLIGIVHAFAIQSQASQNHIIITHEFLHTVGAIDKYDQNGNPLFPMGIANLLLKPLYPQQRAEIMAGRIALSPTNSRMPDNLSQCVIGEQTASEVNWR